jgi:hypothetical protein
MTERKSGNTGSKSRPKMRAQSTIIRPSNSWPMLCLRCGGCCLHLDIFVVNPASIREDGSIDASDTESMIFKPSGEPCPHLAFQKTDDGEIAVCAIHHLSCYPGSPCQQFEQVGAADDVCIMSGYFRTLGR